MPTPAVFPLHQRVTRLTRALFTFVAVVLLIVFVAVGFMHDEFYALSDLVRFAWGAATVLLVFGPTHFLGKYLDRIIDSPEYVAEERVLHPERVQAREEARIRASLAAEAEQAAAKAHERVMRKGLKAAARQRERAGVHAHRQA